MRLDGVEQPRRFTRPQRVASISPSIDTSSRSGLCGSRTSFGRHGEEPLRLEECADGREEPRVFLARVDVPARDFHETARRWRGVEQLPPFVERNDGVLRLWRKRTGDPIRSIFVIDSNGFGSAAGSGSTDNRRAPIATSDAGAPSRISTASSTCDARSTATADPSDQP